MVGDGANDAPAQAEFGIPISAGADFAIEPAGDILAGSYPRSVFVDPAIPPFLPKDEAVPPVDAGS